MHEMQNVEENKHESIEIKLFFKDGYFYQQVGDRIIQLNPWVGVQLEEWNERPFDWYRPDINKYVPNDLMKYLERLEKVEDSKLVQE